MPGHRVRAPWSRIVVAAAFVLAVMAALLLPTGGAGTVATARADRPTAGTLLDDRPLVAFLGDSWTVGVGATGFDGYAPLTAGQLHWPYRNFGVSGSGYSVPGPYDSLFAERIERLAASQPDVVVVQGSLNERNSTPEALGAAAGPTLAELRAALAPGTPVLVLGASYNPGTADETIDRINAAVRSAATANGLPFIDVARGGWTDPGDPALWADSIHPNDRGHALIADRLARLLRALVRG